MNKEAREWLNSASKESLEKMRGCTSYAGLVTVDFLKDPFCALQLGYAILLNKPIFLIVDKSIQIPEALVRVARVIERVDTKNQADIDRASKSLGDFVRNI